MEEEHVFTCLSVKKSNPAKKAIRRVKRLIRNLKSDIVYGTKIRNRGTVILKNEHGIIVVQEPNGSWSLPGGGININESDMECALRELREETTVKGKNSNYQFEIKGRIHRDRHGKRYINLYKIFEITEYENKPRPSNEIRKIGYWRSGKYMRLTSTTKKILDIYQRPWRTPQFRQYCKSVNCAYGDENGCGIDRPELNPPDEPSTCFEDGVPCCYDMRSLDDGH
ncbi:MAG: NUDIX hydrolase [Methanosarcinales archaeon]|jgi:ADP-ribose pyrophosphatase YjhB (NUDIX family)|nr:NUDIX hydrolase [Methanosarcinales archaeon]